MSIKQKDLMAELARMNVRDVRFWTSPKAKGARRIEFFYLGHWRSSADIGNLAGINHATMRVRLIEFAIRGIAMKDAIPLALKMPVQRGSRNIDKAIASIEKIKTRFPTETIAGKRYYKGSPRHAIAVWSNS